MVATVDVKKPLPANMEAEQSLIGSIFHSDEAYWDVVDIVKPDDFYRSEHRILFTAIRSLKAKGEPVDAITVLEKLRSRDLLEAIGGVEYLGQIADAEPSGANAAYFARIVRTKALLRHAVTAGERLIESATGEIEDVSAFLSEVQGQILTLLEDASEARWSPYHKVLSHVQDKIEDARRQGRHLLGLPTGIPKVDALTGGLMPTDLIVIAARPSTGKCLGRGTKVVMFDGLLRAVEDVRAGELLMGPDSQSREVLSLARGREMMFRVRQSNSALCYRVNESHVLSLKKSRTDSSGQHGDVVNLSVREYLAKSPKWQNDHKGYKVGIEFRPADLPLEPYFLGLWLGDGAKRSSRICTADEEVVTYLHEYAGRLGRHVSVSIVKHRTPVYAITNGVWGKGKNTNSIQSILRQMGLICNKHIPESYFSTSRQQRLELLAGILDSDGHLDPRSQRDYEITQTSLRLITQIKYLADTLGFRTGLYPKRASIKSRGFESEVYRLHIGGDLDTIPTRIPRKQAKPWTDRRDWRLTGLSVEPDCVDDYYGFELTGDGLFLLEDMTVTHNTAWMQQMAEGIAARDVPVAIFSLEMSEEPFGMRAIQARSHMDSMTLRTGNYDKDIGGARIAAAVKELAVLPIFINDKPGWHYAEIQAQARRLILKEHVGVVMVDYIGIVKGDNPEHRVRELGTVANGLKELAKRHNLPVVVLSQLNRLVERERRRPTMADIRDSGEVEQIADVVILIHRLRGESEGTIIVDKSRNLQTGEVLVHWDGPTMRYSEVDTTHKEESYREHDNG